MKRKNIIKTLLGTMCLSLASAVVCMLPNATVANAEGFISSENLVVVGAGVRYDTNPTAEDDDGTGLRFCLRASESYLATAEEVGLLVIPSKNLTGDLTVGTSGAVKNVKVFSTTEADDWRDVADETAWEKISTKVSYVADTQVAYTYLYNIPLSDSETDVTVRGYAKVNGLYQYTDMVTRSMRSVAIEACKETATENDTRAALAKYMDEGNVAYFGTQYLNYTVGTDMKLNYASWGNLVQSTKDVKTPAGEYVSAVNVYGNDANSTGLHFRLANAAIKDISSYKYMYVWIYTKDAYANEADVNYTVNFNMGTQNVSLNKDAWTRVVFTKNEAGVFMTSTGKEVFVNGTTPTNIDDFRFTFYPANKSNYVYVTEMRVCNELPTINVSTTAEETALTGNAFNVSYTTENFDTAGVIFTQTVSVNGSAETVLTENTYTPTKKGTYKFIVRAEKNGQLLAMGEKEVVVGDMSERDIGYFTSGDWFGQSGSKVWGYGPTSNVLNVQYGTGEYASPLGGSSLGLQGNTYTYANGMRVDLEKVTIDNISSYKYIYVWIYTTYDADDGVAALDLNVNIGTTDSQAKYQIKKGQWTRLVLAQDENGNYVNASGGKAFAKNFTVDSSNKFRIYLSAADKKLGSGWGWLGWIYIGGLCACNELPELPAGTVEIR